MENVTESFTFLSCCDASDQSYAIIFIFFSTLNICLVSTFYGNYREKMAAKRCFLNELCKK